MLWGAAYGFSIMLSYYILRAVRDEIAADDRDNLQIIWTVVFFVMVFVAVPAYSWIASKYSRGVFVPMANRFFIVCLIGFWASLLLLPVEARPWIDRVFYVWSSIFALFDEAAHPLHDTRIVGREHKSGAVFFVKPLHHVPKGSAGDRVEIRCGFVGQNQSRVAHHHLRDGDALLLAA